ncbi:hypothetical protein Ahy_B07g087956 [Arachis hypogaea]|uniref:PB1-like domain-containing protein n=1 Tax=Arachis hypogaea TaxID=3818 RepID=A0A444YDF8_ARAHY|nr:hypothetical protein Ahy_B07g087956 [Arachis hypogaea]
MAGNGLLVRMSYFSVKVYHHGSFGLQRGQLKYLGRETTVIDYCNEDEWSLIEVYDIVSRQGYLKKDIAAMWYKSQDQNTEEGLRMLRTDEDAMNMANIGVREDMVELFVVHKTSDIHEVVEDVHLLGSTESNMQVKGGGYNGQGPMVTSEAQTVGQVEKNSGPNVEEEIVGNKDESDEEGEGSDGSEDEDYEPKGGEDDSCDSWSSDSRNGDSSEDSAAEVVFGDSDDDKKGAEGLVDVNIRVGDRFEAASTETQTDAAKASGSAKGKEKVVAGLGDEEEGYDSEDFLDMPITDDDENGNSVAKKYPLHKQLKDMSEYKWEVDLRRVKVTCVEGCNWFAYCGKIKNEQTCQLTSCHNKHSCSRELKIGIMHAKWLGKVFLKKIAENPKIKLSTLMKKAYSKWNVELTKSKAARVKQFALDELQGTYIEQYQRLTKVEKQADASGKWVSTYAGRDKYERPQQTDLSKEAESSCHYFGKHKVAGSTRRVTRVISSTISSTMSSTISSQASRQSQAAAKKTNTSRPKRKSPSNDISSQQSQARSKKAKMTPSNNNSGQQLKDAAKHNNLRVLPTPSKHVSISQLKFMARTPPKAWKKM